MTNSWKVRGIREHYRNERERLALPEPPVSEEERLARALKAAPDGLTLTELTRSPARSW